MKNKTVEFEQHKNITAMPSLFGSIRIKRIECIHSKTVSNTHLTVQAWKKNIFWEYHTKRTERGGFCTTEEQKKRNTALADP